MKAIHFLILMSLLPVPVLAAEDVPARPTLKQINASFAQKRVKDEVKQTNTQPGGKAESVKKESAEDRENNLTPVSIYNNNGYFSE